MTSAIERITEVATNEALKMMAAKASCTTAEIVSCVLADPKGATARYLAGLIAAAIREVPAKLAA
ncbi:hypothetical protein ACOTCL_18090 [Achromobacter xylosoxidans]